MTENNLIKVHYLMIYQLQDLEMFIREQKLSVKNAE
jgi:hypothetical protein